MWYGIRTVSCILEDIENKMVKCWSELALDKYLNNFNSLTWGENVLDH